MMSITRLEEPHLFQRAAETIVRVADDYAGQRGVFTIALSGGSTPARLYSLLATDYSTAIPWRATQVFFGDERCVPPDHSDSNYRMANEALLSRVAVPPESIHRMKGEMSPQLAAEEYAGEIRAAFGLGPGELPSFDLILLGLGEDGHTASIFPGSDVVHEASLLVSAPFVSKLGAHRLTITPPVLLHARHVTVLVIGSNKAEALKHALDDPYEPERYPSHLLRKAKGDVEWLVSVG